MNLKIKEMKPNKLYSEQHDSYCTWNGSAWENDGKVAGAYFYGLEKAENCGFLPVPENNEKEISCEGFTPLDYEYLLEVGGKVTFYNGGRDTIESINKPFIEGENGGCVHWMNIRSYQKPAGKEELKTTINTEDERLINYLVNNKAEENNSIDLNAYAIGCTDMLRAIKEKNGEI